MRYLGVQIPDRLKDGRDLALENDALELLLVAEMPTLDVQSRCLMSLLYRSLHQALAANQRILQHERRPDKDFGPLAKNSERGLADPARELDLHPLSNLLDVLREKMLVLFSRRQEDQKDIAGFFVQRDDVVRAQLVALELGHDLADHVHQVFVLAAPCCFLH